MSNWAYVENNEIKELHDLLPKSWRNISGLRLSESNIEFLNSLGWYKVEKNNSYDSSRYDVYSFKHEYVEGKVIETPVLVEKQQPQPQPQKSKAEFLDELRQKRNEKLAECDWTQLVDSPLSKVDIERWAIYRQQLRDLPSVYQNNEVLSLDEIQWPNIDTIEINPNLFEEN